jgi:hypothetical protein
VDEEKLSHWVILAWNQVCRRSLHHTQTYIYPSNQHISPLYPKKGMLCTTGVRRTLTHPLASSMMQLRTRTVKRQLVNRSPANSELPRMYYRQLMLNTSIRH